MSETIYINDNGNRRKATEKEAQSILDLQTEAAEQARLIEAEQTKKDADRASAMAKLTALGLNEEEVNAIIGI